MSVLIKSFQAVAVDWFTELGVCKCVYSIILLDFQIKCGRYSHKGTEYLSSQGCCIGLFFNNLQVSIDIQLSFQLLQVAITIKLIFKGLFQQKDLLIASFYFQYGFKYSLTFQIVIFFFYGYLEASSLRILFSFLNFFSLGGRLS